VHVDRLYVRTNKNISAQVEVRSNKNTEVQGDQKVIAVICPPPELACT